LTHKSGLNSARNLTLTKDGIDTSEQERMMTQKTSARFAASVLGFILLLPLTARSQNTSLTPDDREVDRVQAMVLQSKNEAEQFSKSGGKASDPKHPNLKWTAKLWRYRDKHPGTPATTIATAEALRLLSRVDRLSEMQLKADTLMLADPAWKRVLYVLLAAANKVKDYSYFISKAEALAQGAVDSEIKASARYMIGEAYRTKGDIELARIAFQAVLTQYPGTTLGKEAEGNLWEIEFLNLGQAAPLFERTTINGDPISLASFKGKVVVLKFWGTY
jgi:tetratricopeptide (TPR) repeat protein